jgi:hypothetical protein
MLAAWRWVLNGFDRASIAWWYIFAAFGLGMMVIAGRVLIWHYERAGWPSGLNAINCWAFVFAKWLESGPKKNWILVKMSEHTVVPHAAFAASIEGLAIVELKPIAPRKGFAGFIRCFWHESDIRSGIGEESRSDRRAREEGHVKRDEGEE